MTLTFRPVPMRDVPMPNAPGKYFSLWTAFVAVKEGSALEVMTESPAQVKSIRESIRKRAMAMDIQVLSSKSGDGKKLYLWKALPDEAEALRGTKMGKRRKS